MSRQVTHDKGRVLMIKMKEARRAPLFMHM
jgi:hypothetical protein